MPSEKLTFPGAHGDALAARLELPEVGEPVAYALFAHCFTCTKDIFAASRIAKALAERGIAVLRFDFTGLGSSEGEFANTGFSSNVGDLLAAVEYLRAERQAPAIVIGHSLGGAAVLAAAGQIPECRAVATIGAPFTPGHVTHLFADHLEQIAAEGKAEVLIAGRPFTVSQSFVEDLQEQTQEEKIASLGKALLVFHSPIDRIVSVDNAAQIYRAAKHPKSFVSLDTADHLVSKRADAEYVAAVLTAWAARYTDEAPAPAQAKPEEGAVVVQEASWGPYQQSIAIGPHRLLADEPTSVGGKDSGPTPYDLLLAGLGACTSMTLRMYADHKGWPLEQVKVVLKHSKIHAKDCEDCESATGRVDVIDRELRILGPELSEEQLTRLEEIANKCPVHKTLHGETKVPTTRTNWK